MSNYSRVEINLVPPELLPPPTLRLAVVASVLIVIATLSYMGLAAVLKLYPINSTKEAITDKQVQIDAKADISGTHQQLVDTREKVDRYGRMVAMASRDYVEIPVLLDRLARIIPDGVYLTGVSNDKPNAASTSTFVDVNLMSSQDRPELVQQTLQAFKRDVIFHDCFMPGARWQSEPVNPQFAEFGIDWNVSGPGLPGSVNAGKYEFTIRANIRKPIDASYLALQEDYSMHLADIKFLTPPSNPEDGDDEGADDAAESDDQAAAEPAEAANAPDGVTVAEVH